MEMIEAAFAKRVKALSAELFDEILDFILAFENGQLVAIDRDYKPPSTLQIDRSTRQIAIENYYAATTFFVSQLWRVPNLWIRSITSETRRRIKSIHVERPLHNRPVTYLDELLDVLRLYHLFERHVSRPGGRALLEDLDLFNTFYTKIPNGQEENREKAWKPLRTILQELHAENEQRLKLARSRGVIFISLPLGLRRVGRDRRM